MEQLQNKSKYDKYKIKNKVLEHKLRSKLVIDRESYETYKIKREQISKSNVKWIYSILDGNKEKDKVLYSDDQFVVVPDALWNGSNISKLHLLAIVRDKSLKSIRDLTSKNIPLLQHIMTKTLQTIEKKYHINKNKIKIYLHYPPSAWHLHIHFCNIENTSVTSSVEYSHELNQVIFNLSINSKYYKTFQINNLVKPK